MNYQSNFYYKFKVISIGEGAVGKTAIMTRYTIGIFDPLYAMTTLGSNFLYQSIEVDGKNIEFAIWDIGAQEQFQKLRTIYFKGSNGALAVFDLTRSYTLLKLPGWISSIKKACGNIPMIMIGNKLDLEELREVNRDEAIDMAKRLGCSGYLETSAKTGENVYDAYDVLARLCSRKADLDLGEYSGISCPSTPYIKIGMNQMEKKKEKRKKKKTEIKLEESHLEKETELSDYKSLKNKFSKEEIELIDQKVNEILIRMPREGELRFLVFGDEDSQKPLLSKLLRVEKVSWPPKIHSILYTTLDYTMKIDQKYDFQLYFLSNLKRLKENEELFNRACEHSDGVVIFYDPNNHEDFTHTAGMAKMLRDNNPELEIILTTGSDIPTSLFYELKELERDYDINNNDDYNSLISELLINTLNRKKKIQKEIKFATSKLEEFQNQLYDQKARREFMEFLRSIEQPKKGELKKIVPTTLENKIFISYSHKDKDPWLERLRVNLKPLVRKGIIQSWDDTLIKPGKNWKNEIQNALTSARVGILLVSADFLASDFISEEELPSLLNAANERGVTILPVILGHCRYSKTEGLKDLQAVNDPSRPLVSLTEGEQQIIFKKVADTVEDIFSK